MLSESDRAYLEANHSAAMITVSDAGLAKAARVGVALLDGRLLSSGTRGRHRTRRLRRDPRCTLFVFDAGGGWLALETTVRILDGPEVPEETLRLFRVMQGRERGTVTWFGQELDDESFKQALIDEGRLLYEFDVERGYGMH